MTSPFVKFRNAIEDLITSSFHKIVDLFTPTLNQAADDLKSDIAPIAEAALAAALPHIGDSEAAYQAAKDAAIAKAKELGTPQVATLLNSIRTVAVNAAAQAQQPAVTAPIVNP